MVVPRKDIVVFMPIEAYQSGIIEFRCDILPFFIFIPVFGTSMTCTIILKAR